MSFVKERDISRSEYGGDYRPRQKSLRRTTSIRINDQWRICFKWRDRSPGPSNVGIVDNHWEVCYGVTPIHPGEHLAEELKALKMSAAELARKINVPTHRVTQILNGTRSIMGDTALRLGHFFGTRAQFWLNLQSLYDLRLAQAGAEKTKEASPVEFLDSTE